MKAARRAALVVLLAALPAAPPAEAQDERPIVKCMGDSITLGSLPFDEEDIGGYPRRLQPLLRRGGMADVVVQNYGVGGETTIDALNRLGTVLAGGGDVFILVEGTNDIELIAGGKLLYDDTLANLNLMTNLAAGIGMEAFLGTIIPRLPGGATDRQNLLTYELNQRIRESSYAVNRPLIDFWDTFPYRQLSTYVSYYYSGPDPVGHPNSAGFDLMAEAAAAAVLGNDTQRPVDGRVLSPLFAEGEAEEVGEGTQFEAELYDFGDGILQSSATFAVNGSPIPTMVAGNPRRSTLVADWDDVKRCKAVVTIQAEDRAEMPNRTDFPVATYAVRGRTLISGDGNGDCRVDGRDLAALGPHFGTTILDLGYDDEFDFVNDDEIDGEDLARLAANFGRGSL